MWVISGLTDDDYLANPVALDDDYLSEAENPLDDYLPENPLDDYLPEAENPLDDFLPEAESENPLDEDYLPDQEQHNDDHESDTDEQDEGGEDQEPQGRLPQISRFAEMDASGLQDFIVQQANPRTRRKTKGVYFVNSWNQKVDTCATRYST